MASAERRTYGPTGTGVETRIVILVSTPNNKTGTSPSCPAWLAPVKDSTYAWYRCRYRKSTRLDNR